MVQLVKKMRLEERQSPKKQIRNYIMVYTLLFIAMAATVFSYFFINGKSFIWHPDGWNQHYKALVYFAQWMRKIIRTLLFEHRLSFPEWNFHLGYGSGILTTLHYYAIGDPLNLFSHEKNKSLSDSGGSPGLCFLWFFFDSFSETSIFY